VVVRLTLTTPPMLLQAMIDLLHNPLVVQGRPVLTAQHSEGSRQIMSLFLSSVQILLIALVGSFLEAVILSAPDYLIVLFVVLKLVRAVSRSPIGFLLHAPEIHTLLP